VKLLELIVKRKILVLLLTILVVILGSFSMFKLDKELLPEIGMDGAFVEIAMENTSAIEIERTITTPIEQKLGGLDGIESVQSETVHGLVTLQILFERGKGDELVKEVETMVTALKGEHSQITHTTVSQYGGKAAYEFFFDLSGGSMEEMTDFAKNILEPRLEELPEVRDVQLVGALENEVSVKINRQEVLNRQMDINHLVQAIQQANSNETLGELSAEKDTHTLRWNTQLTSIDQLKNIDIPTQKGIVKLHEIADVSLTEKDNSSNVWKNGSKDFIFVQVGRVENVTQIEMAEAVREELDKIHDEHLIENFQLNEIVAQADYVDDSISGVTDNIWIGGLIAIIVLILFLRNIRATFIIALSIPATILLTIATIWFLDYSLNLLTLIGLGLGIGMIVDASIVILESIYKKKEQGIANFKSVVEGTKEVASAVLASMLTTIVVFFPIGLIGGDLGAFLIILSTVVTITLISSVVISFTLIPSLSDKLMRVRVKNKEKTDGKLMKFYNRIVTWTIKKRRNSLAVIGLFFVMFIGSILLISKIPMSVMPDLYNRYTELSVDLKPGTSNHEKIEFVEKMNNELQKVEDVESIYIMDNGGMLYSIINMTKGNDIKHEQKTVNENILKTLRSLQEDYPIASINGAMSSGGGSPVQINIKGDDFEELKHIAHQLKNELDTIDGIVGLNSSIDHSSFEQEIVLKEEAIEKAGIGPEVIKNYIGQSFMNFQIGHVTMNEENIPLTLQWSNNLDSKQTLMNSKIMTSIGEQPLSSFIELRNIEVPNEITHDDGKRVVTVTADIEGKDLGTVNREVQDLLQSFETPNGYRAEIAGSLEEQQQLMIEMLFVLGIAIFLVYLVMAVQFNHLGHPLIVMSVIPMTIVGVILGLFVTQMELNLMSGMGTLMLIGIVLNNAILLIDKINKSRSEGTSVQEAILVAGKTRLRPIFMTTLTTAGGMLPLALASGTSGNYQAPMAVVIISGLMFSTFITLLLVPAVYRLFTLSKKNKVFEESEHINVEKNIPVETMPVIK